METLCEFDHFWQIVVELLFNPVVKIINKPKTICHSKINSTNELLKNVFISHEAIYNWIRKKKNMKQFGKFYEEKKRRWD